MRGLFVKLFRLFAATPLLAMAGLAVGEPTNIQQQFDAASSALDARNWTEALRLYEALETRLDNRRSLAIVRARKASALIELGRGAEATAALRLALPALPADDTTLNPDRFIALTTLGRIAEASLDYDEALRQYRLAIAVPLPDPDRVSAYGGLIQTQLFTNAEGALRDADAALVATAASSDRSIEGQLRTLRGRALLNLGRLTEARAELGRALRLLGNLTMRVDRADLLVRSDLAIAALLAGDEEDAQRYLAYTGAGRFLRGGIAPAAISDLPQCGGGIAPDDVVVVQAYVDRSGRVASVSPIYASRQGPAALTFARAVSHWLFKPEEANAVPALLRSVVRFELRCSQLPPRLYAGDSDADLSRLATAAPQWRETIETWRYRSAAALRAGLAAGNPQLPLLMILGRSPELAHPEREAVLRRALSAAADEAPPSVVAGIAIAMTWASEQAQSRRFTSTRYAEILVLPEIVRSPAAAAYLRLAQARSLIGSGDNDQAFAIATEIAGGPEAARDSHIKTEAQEILVAIHAARREEAAARAVYDAMGPRAARCNVLPRLRNWPFNNSEFPTEALRWGFEGWATSETSARPNGDGFGSRTVIAYPPFVFGAAAREMHDRMRFAPFFTPDAAPCVVSRVPIRFRIAP